MRTFHLKFVGATVLRFIFVAGILSFFLMSSKPPAQAQMFTAGLGGDYYDGVAFTTFQGTYTDATIDFSPAETTLGTNRAGGSTTFSVRWTGYVKADFTETYTFYTQSDDGVRLFVRDQAVVNNWTDHATTENSGTIALTANTWYPIRLEFYNNTGAAVIQLKYSSASVTKVIIPSSNLAVAAPGSLTITTGARALSNFNIRGTIAKGSGTFVIDHPQHPTTQLLYHSFVESPDVKNLYDGIVTLNAKGEATIQLPDYFEALNKDFRYQFFALDEAMPNLYIKEEERGNRFTIAGGAPDGRVSWQITGIRHDPFILANPPRVEVLKGTNEVVNKGECIFEPLCK